ncbi:metal ABC transporter ATP-binding protein [Actinomycetospora cinnamomea]|uniref:Zinc/manganese transport system ATP-binding protein n=1 Tax=Actinomycetospora cinnamomea TaxID=663609 RepID=A0A2U1EDH7_9PSEU|nr:metal ABC transporter ATP-binding protein [Actinomycetospora cinnamomea]PVY98014.1 zinc/manganese transport system ATP-binding protein [Actinomycetospora cinnamomea]
MTGAPTGHATAGAAPAAPAVALRGAAVERGTRRLWSDLDLDVPAGEFIAILGPNGSGKTTLLQVLLGLLPLAAGEAQVGGRRPQQGSNRVGYVPQQKALDPNVPLRGRDFVGLGLDGHRFGPVLGRRRRERRARIDDALHQVGADAWADAPVGRLSGGEQQRLRVAQALVGDPDLLLCDEPLLSLDLAHQGVVVDLLDRRRRDHGTAVLFVTHEINPVLPVVDRVLYLVDGRFRIGTPDEVMTSETLSELYQAPVDVVRVRDRILVVGHEDSVVHHTGAADDVLMPAPTHAS